MSSKYPADLFGAFKWGLWNDLLITYRAEELTYTSLTVPGLAVSIPLTTEEERCKGSDINYVVMTELSELVITHAIYRVEWRFLSEPEIDTSWGVQNFMDTLAMIHTGSVERIVIDISEKSLPFVVNDILHIVAPGSQFSGRIIFRCRDVSQSEHSLAYALIASLGASDCRRDNVELEVVISKSRATAWKELARVSAMVTSITIDHLFSKGRLDRLIWFLETTRGDAKDLKITIKRFSVKGETSFHLPRGNVILSIESIRSDSRIRLSCNGELGCLTVTKDVADNITGRSLAINLLCVAQAPPPASGVLERIKAQFGFVAAAIKLES